MTSRQAMRLGDPGPPREGDSRESVNSEAAAQREALIGGLPNEDAVRILIALYANGTSDVGDAAKATLADLLFTAHLVGIGPDRAAKAVLSQQAGDEWLAVASSNSSLTSRTATTSGSRFAPIRAVRVARRSPAIRRPESSPCTPC
jgi:hypothetical protein